MDELDKLYKGLVEEGLYTKSFDEFKAKYNTEESQKFLYEGLKEEGLYTKEFSDFSSKYFTVKKKDLSESGEQKEGLITLDTKELEEARIGDSFTEETRDVSDLFPFQDPEKDEEDQKNSLIKDLGLALKSGATETLAGISGIPNLITKGIASVVLDEEELAELNSLPPEQREVVLGTVAGVTPQGQAVSMSAEAQNKLTEIADNLQSKMTQYDGNIVDDIFSGDSEKFFQGVRRIATSGVQSLPSMATAFIPVVGLGLVGAGAGAQKQERLESEGDDLDMRSVGNAVVSGVAEGVFEKVTLNIFKPLKGILKGNVVLAKSTAKEIVGTIFKDIGREGLSEGATEIVNEMADKFISGHDVSLIQATKNVLDAVVVGAAIGGLGGGAKPVANYAMFRSMNQAERTEFKKSQTKVNELNQARTPETSKTIDKQIDQVQKEFNEFRKNRVQKIEGMEYNDRKKIVDLSKEVDNINEIIKSEDANLSLETESDLKNQVTDLEKKKSALIDKPKAETLESMTEFLEDKHGKDFKESDLSESEFNQLEKLKLEQEKTKVVESKPKKDETPTKQTGKDTKVDKKKDKADRKKPETKPDKKDAKPKVIEGDKGVTKKPVKSELSQKEQSRKDTEATVDDLLSQNKSKEEILESFEAKNERMMAEDYLTRKKIVSNKDSKKIVDDSFVKAQKEIEDKTKSVSFLKKGLRSIAKKFWDRQYEPKMLLMKAGGKVVRNYMITSKGAAGQARFTFDEAHDKIYKGLSSKDVKNLDKVIQLRRFISIDEKRAKDGRPDVVHPDFINQQISRSALQEIEKEIGSKKYKDLNKRADEYFKTFEGLLNDMHEAGIISEELKDSFFGVDYQPRVFLEFLKTAEQESSILEMGAEEVASLASPQVKRLESGSNTSLITDSEYLLGRSINTRAKTIAMNKTNKRLVEFMEDQKKVVDALKKKKNPTKKEKQTITYFNELSKRVKDNPIVGHTKSGNPKYKYEAKSGEKTQVYYKDGEKHQIIMEESLFDQYNDNLKSVWNNSNIRERASLVSLSAVVKTLATGNNPAFFITNSPRDLMFIATFSEVYTPIVPYNMALIAKDAYKGIKSIRKKDKVFQKFIKYGGMMDFLHKQGQFKGTNAINRFINKNIGRNTKEQFNKTLNAVTLKNIQMWSEMGFRIGVFNRSVKQQMKQLGVKDESEITKDKFDNPQQVIDDIYHNATAAARNTTDFNQGGTFIKDADAVLPYLNASVQGVRVGMENLHERPIETSFRMAQTAAILSSVPIGIGLALIGSNRGGENEPEEDKDLTNTELYLKARKGVSKYDKVNYMIFFNGKRTKDGEFHFRRVAKPHFMTPITSYAEGLQVEVLKSVVGDTSPNTTIDNVKFALEKNISPFEFAVGGNFARMPILKASMTYDTGYDFYRNKDLSHLKGKVPEPVEGHESKSVNEFYKKIGENYNVSPARMKGAVESIITTPSTTPFVGALYGGLDWIHSDKDASEAFGSLAKDLAKSTLGRVIKETSDFNRRINFDELFKKEFSKIEIENIKNKNKFKDLSKKFKDGEISKNELGEELSALAKKNPFDAERMTNVIVATISNPTVSAYVYEIKYSTPKQQALMLAELFGDGFMGEVKEMGKYNQKLKVELLKYADIKGETIFEYNKLIEDSK